MYTCIINKDEHLSLYTNVQYRFLQNEIAYGPQINKATNMDPSTLWAIIDTTFKHDAFLNVKSD